MGESSQDTFRAAWACPASPVPRVWPFWNTVWCPTSSVVPGGCECWWLNKKQYQIDVSLRQHVLSCAPTNFPSVLRARASKHSLGGSMRMPQGRLKSSVYKTDTGFQSSPLGSSSTPLTHVTQGASPMSVCVRLMPALSPVPVGSSSHVDLKSV